MKWEMARKHKHEEHENHERWLVSYADFITLLFAFFVVMYSMSRVDNKRVAQASQSIRWALHHAGTGGVAQLPIFEGPPSNGGCVANVGTSGATTSEVRKAMEVVKIRLEKRLKPFLLDKKVSQSVVVESVNGKLIVKLAAGHFFDPAQAALRPEALPVLDAIANELKELARPVRIEAHTDDAPVVSTRYRNNWDLSAARASTVTALLEAGVGIPADRLSAGGMGSGHPVVANDTPEHRETNRRVEMVVDVFPSDASAAAAQQR